MDDKIIYYSNMSTLKPNYTDFQFEFLNITSVDNGNHELINLQPPVLISMSPQHAKFLSERLVKGLRQYESNYGEIHISKDMMAENR